MHSTARNEGGASITAPRPSATPHLEHRTSKLPLVPGPPVCQLFSTLSQTAGYIDTLRTSLCRLILNHRTPITACCTSIMPSKMGAPHFILLSS